MNKRFSLVSAILCLGIVSGVDAAPSVRVLGSATGSGAKTSGAVVDAKKGNNIKSSVLNANTGVKKAASIKTMAPTATTMQPVARASSARVGTTGTGAVTTATGANRFSGIASKINVQKNYNPGSAGVITSSNPAAFQELSERVGNLEQDLYNKYYTKVEVDGKLSDIGETLDDHETRITSLENQIALMGGGGGGGGGGNSVQFLTDEDFDLFDDLGN